MTKLEEIEARLAAATPGPWTLGSSGVMVRAPHAEALHGFSVIAEVYSRAPMEQAAGEAERVGNGHIIANAPADIRHLVDRVKRLEAALTDINELTCLDHDEAGKIARAALAEPQP